MRRRQAYILVGYYRNGYRRSAVTDRVTGNIPEEEPEGTDDVPDTMEDIPGAGENNEENAENDGVNAEEAGTTSDNSE